MVSHIQSPIVNRNPNPKFLGPNNDDFERARSRAARAVSNRRRSAAFSPPPPVRSSQPFLDQDQIMDLFHNCIKLASENKINQKNTWEFGLIDHLSEIVRVRSEDEDNETNFQKASCTLEAGVKIYSLRVDSVHSETYKVLGGINRAGCEEEKEENVGDGGHTETDQVEGLAKKDLNKKFSPITTLESTFEALNAKKFDEAFSVDPLYHQTSAQFDEGGAKGLLLNNLGVYGGCRVLFDSFESPEKNILSEQHNQVAELIDLSFAKEKIEQLMMYVPVKNDISPTLRDIVNQFDEDNRRPSVPAAQKQMVEEGIDDYDHSEVEANAFDDCGSWSFDHDDHTSYGQEVPRDGFAIIDENFPRHPDNGEYTIRDPNLDQKLEKIADFLSLGLGFTSKSNAWAGPDHWKYRKSKDSEQIRCSDTEPEITSKKPKTKKGVADLDFTKSLDKEMPNTFAPPKNPKSLLLPANRAPCNITLPEDCHYRPESLVRLLVLPDVMCLGKKARKCSDESRQDSGTISFAPWDNENMEDDHFDIPTYNTDTEEPGTLVRPPRQVNKIDIEYDKVSKQVDVHALKNRLWSNIQESIQIPDVGMEAGVSLRQVLHRFSSDSWPIASSPEDISPHLFFICLLHLANEHCLSLRDRPTLDELDIYIPPLAFAT